MPGKRRDENRSAVNKDNYDSDGDNGGDPNDTWQQASADKISARKIIKVRKSITHTTPREMFAPTPVRASNGGFGGGAFANVNLVAAPAPAANPFAATTLAAPAPAPTAASNLPPATTKLGRLNTSFLNFLEKQLQTNPCATYEKAVEDYVRQYQKAVGGTSGSANESSGATSNGSSAKPPNSAVKHVMAMVADTPAKPAPAPAPAAAQSSFDFNAPAATAAKPSFDFGAKASTAPAAAPVASAPAVPKFSFGAPAAGAPAAAPPSFSFGAPAAGAAPVAAAAPAFSFAAASAAAPAAAAPAAAGAAAEEGEPSDELTDKCEEAIKETNTEEATLFEARCKMYKLNPEEGWKDCGKGVVRFMDHNTTHKKRIVLRNQIGKVQLNAAVSNGMEFTKLGGKQSSVRFVAMDDGKVGQYMLKVNPENLDKMHGVLESMAK
jgi:hypothetical protein